MKRIVVPVVALLFACLVHPTPAQCDECSDRGAWLSVKNTTSVTITGHILSKNTGQWDIPFYPESQDRVQQYTTLTCRSDYQIWFDSPDIEPGQLIADENDYEDEDGLEMSFTVKEKVFIRILTTNHTNSGLDVVTHFTGTVNADDTTSDNDTNYREFTAREWSGENNPSIDSPTIASDRMRIDIAQWTDSDGVLNVRDTVTTTPTVLRIMDYLCGGTTSVTLMMKDGSSTHNTWVSACDAPTWQVDRYFAEDDIDANRTTIHWIYVDGHTCTWMSVTTYTQSDGAIQIQGDGECHGAGAWQRWGD